MNFTPIKRTEAEKIRAFWRVAFGFGLLMLFLYSVELLKIAALVFSHEVVPAEITLRRESPAFCEVGYRYKFRETVQEGTKLYRFPETLFVSGLTEGEKIDVLVSPTFPWWSLPRKLILFEVMLPLCLVILASMLTRRAIRELRRGGQRDQIPL